MLSFPNKHGLPEGDGIAQGLPEVGGRGRGGRKGGWGGTGFCIHKYFFPRNKPFIKVCGVSFTVKTQGLITFEEQWTTRAKKTGPVQLMGREGGSLAYNILDIRLEWFN